MLSIENQKNTICIGFQFHNPKLSQDGVLKRIFTMQVYVQGTKKAIDSLFCEALYRKLLNTICIVFRFYNAKLSQERCFKPYVYYIKLLKGALPKKQLIASFVEHFEAWKSNKWLFSVLYSEIKSREVFHTLSTIWDYVQGTGYKRRYQLRLS